MRNETVGTGPSAIVAEDFDLDGNLDLAVVRDGGGSPECSVVVLRGLGDSDFHDTELVFTVGDSGSAGDFPTGIAAANFDPNTDPANTLPDILVSMYDRSTDAGKVVLLVNVSPEPGTIDFDDASLVSASVGDRPMGIAIGDFTGDGALDAITADYLDDQISVVEGTGDGEFDTPPTTFGTHDGPTGVVAGHLNPGEDSGLDTYLDVVTANDGAGTDDITVFLGDGAGGTLGGGLGINHYSLNGGSGPTAIALGEFNLDTAIDIVVGNSGSDDLSLFAGDGDGTFATAEVGSFGADIANPWAFAVGEWKTQTEDVLYLGDKNVGFGIEIIEYPAASGEYYAFLTNDTQDSDPGLSTSCDDGESAFTDSEGKFVSNTVQVVKIDPAPSRLPTRARPTTGWWRPSRWGAAHKASTRISSPARSRQCSSRTPSTRRSAGSTSPSFSTTRFRTTQSPSTPTTARSSPRKRCCRHRRWISRVSAASSSIATSSSHPFRTTRRVVTRTKTGSSLPWEIPQQIPRGGSR